MEFKERIRQLREDKKLSPSQLAAAFNKSESAVRMWETGRSKPDTDTLIKLVEYFDCSTDYMLGLSDIRNEKEKENNNNLKESIMAETNAFGDDYKAKFFQTILPLVYAFSEVQDKEGLSKEETDQFFSFIELFELIAEFYNTFDEKFVNDIYFRGKSLEEKMNMLYINGLDIIDRIEKLVYIRLGIEEKTKSEAEFNEYLKKYREARSDYFAPQDHP